MAKYVILREAMAVLIEEAINLYFEKGYRLKEVVVDSKPLHLYLAVISPKRVSIAVVLSVLQGPRGTGHLC